MIQLMNDSRWIQGVKSNAYAYTMGSSLLWLGINKPRRGTASRNSIRVTRTIQTSTLAISPLRYKVCGHTKVTVLRGEFTVRALHS